MKNNFYQKGEGEIAGIIVLVIIGLAVWGFLSLFGFSFGVEREGAVKYDDCREIITLKEGDWKTYTNKFTCAYAKTGKGLIYGGECAHIETENGICTTAYVYEKKPANVCTQAPNLYLGYDDMCYTTKQY